MRPRSILAAILAAALTAGCDAGGGPVARRCQAPSALPGSTPMPEHLGSVLTGVNVPAEALLSRRRVCNRLAIEPGAFARRHALDAIDWRPWSADALAEAATLGRPVFVLSGSSACAPCNDLTRDVLSRRGFARDINRHFVPLLVDREERPDADAYLMLAVQVLTGGGGWPAVAFLQADGRPFEAHSWGAAGASPKKLERIVTEVLRRLSLGGGTISERTDATAEKMERRATLDTSGPVPDAGAVSSALRGYLVEAFDVETGSFGSPPLFPRAPALEFLLQLHRERGDNGALDMALTSLAKLRQGPLFDTTRGGFRRFARSAAWQDPAPEMMLADNAALASVYLDAAGASGRADLLDAARAVVGFVRRDLALEGGGFAASLDTAFTPPARDGRLFADANALAISMLVRAAAVLREPRYLEEAVAAARQVDSRLRDGGRLVHCLHAGARRCADGYLADQALVALAFLDLDAASAPGGRRWLDLAITIADAMPARFGHEGTGGFFLAPADAESLPLRLKPSLDSAVACGNSAAAWLYVRLATLTGDSRYAAEASRTFEAFSEVLSLRPMALPSMATALAAAGAPPRDEDGAPPRDQDSAPPQLDPAPAVQP